MIIFFAITGSLTLAILISSVLPYVPAGPIPVPKVSRRYQITRRIRELSPEDKQHLRSAERYLGNGDLQSAEAELYRISVLRRLFSRCGSGSERVRENGTSAGKSLPS